VSGSAGASGRGVRAADLTTARGAVVAGNCSCRGSSASQINCRPPPNRGGPELGGRRQSTGRRGRGSVQRTRQMALDRTTRDTDNGANKDDGEVLWIRTVSSRSSNWSIPAIQRSVDTPAPGAKTTALVTRCWGSRCGRAAVANRGRRAGRRGIMRPPVGVDASAPRCLSDHAARAAAVANQESASRRHGSGQKHSAPNRRSTRLAHRIRRAHG